MLAVWTFSGGKSATKMATTGALNFFDFNYYSSNRLASSYRSNDVEAIVSTAWLASPNVEKHHSFLLD